MCPYEEKLTAWLLGDLPPEEQQAMTRHLQACDTCRKVRDELTHVLTPLRSGLEKDRHLRVEPHPTPCTGCRESPRPFWYIRYERLRRAALFALSFGALFAGVSVVYRQTAGQHPNDENVTHITFHRKEAPAPALAPAMGAAKAPPTAKDDLADFKPEAVHPEAAAPAVVAPALPAPEPMMPKLRRLVKTEGKAAISAAPAPAAKAERSYSAAPVTAKAKAAAKSERAKASASAITRPPADLQIKPIGLAARPASTNTIAIPTNTIPTNAVAPTERPPR